MSKHLKEIDNTPNRPPRTTHRATKEGPRTVFPAPEGVCSSLRRREGKMKEDMEEEADGLRLVPCVRGACACDACVCVVRARVKRVCVMRVCMARARVCV